MAIALINKGITRGTTGDATVTIDTTGANLLLVVIGWYTFASRTFTDGNSNAGWTTLTGYGTNLPKIEIRYVLDPATVGASHAFSIDTGDSGSIAAYAFSGVGAYESVTGRDGGTATSHSTNTLTPSANGALLVAGAAFGAASTESGAGTYTGLQQVNYSAGNGFGLVTSHYIQPTAAAVEETYSGSSVERALTQACFTPAAEATGHPASRRMGGVKFSGSQLLGISRW